MSRGGHIATRVTGSGPQGQGRLSQGRCQHQTLGQDKDPSRCPEDQKTKSPAGPIIILRPAPVTIRQDNHANVHM